ncbi:glycoside hydrolase domain-containing protein [Hymenobacter sp. GOD-10R]|uniref:glycoside hydrolase domain-containing protein n=1 Tax=Hymenobacter sp. GOD-10R TaxID=3093922 RepID=UPI002D7739BE|nr:glycoside hydrolase domain-containing protein [Hymenobacter sp. GOD-10R]WRQ26599.1 glycoside hydrolase domain-containing protein [Hymenobacter sp. GOD-10R]
MRYLLRLFFLLICFPTLAQTPTQQVNVFLGTSGDHGQLSPAASYPFSMLSLGPQTYPNTHTGYEHLARTFLGFTHTRFEGVGCQGAGGNLLVKPCLGPDPQQTQLLKKSEQAEPGYYSVTFANGIGAELTVGQRFGLHRYHFPAGAERTLYLDLAHSLANGFKQEEHATQDAALSGWIEAGTTCSAGTYRLYYYLELNQPAQWTAAGAHQLLVRLPATGAAEVEVRVAFSSVSVADAQATVQRQAHTSFEEVRRAASLAWNAQLARVQVQGEADRQGLFYSLLYRTLQSPYLVSEPDGRYRAIDGSLQKSKRPVYNGWAIWDNYHTQLPLFSLAYPNEFQDIAPSLANLYRYGKKNFATQHEPSPTVRTEHAIVVLLDAVRKGYAVDLRGIRDSLISEVERLDYSHPDKALESSYDAWALSEILGILKDKSLSAKYRQKALQYQDYWRKDFQDMTRPDVDRLPTRGLYQGTIWQYRWNVPFDIKGLQQMMGGEEAFRQQLDAFFAGDYYNHANETDLQAPTLYNATQQPWKSQALMHQLAADTVVQHYFNDNSRGIDPYIGRIYQNQPQAYLRTMDDDAGAMSAWYVLTACGLMPACVGQPVYYLNLPLFRQIKLQVAAKQPLVIEVENYAPARRYIQAARLNGKPLNRNWLTHQELAAGGTLVFVAADEPNRTWGTQQPWIATGQAEK